MNLPEEAAPADNLLRDNDPAEGAAIQRLLDKPLSIGDLREHTRRVATPLQIAEKDLVRLLVFQMGEELMAWKAFEVHQVTRATRVHRIPHRSNTIIRGLCNLDGTLMLCADLARLLELSVNNGPSKENEQPWMIVLGDEKNRWAVEVDSVKGVVTVPQHAFRRPPITVNASLACYTTNLVPFDQGTAALLDMQRVVSGFQAALR